MALEIERKFLLKSDAWRKDVISSSRIVQGYLSSSGATVRVRVMDECGFLTVKGRAEGIARNEYEYLIPVEEAKEMLENLVCDPPVEKIRCIVPAGDGLFWEIDEYCGANAPLFTAEIELPDENTPFAVPQWLGEEVSNDRRYTNRALSRTSYSTWSSEDK